MKEFTETLDTAVFTTKFVVEQKHLITKVYHDIDDGAWQFFSNDNYESFEKVAMVISLGEIIEIDSTILELADMPEGYLAERVSINSPWLIKEKKEISE